VNQALLGFLQTHRRVAVATLDMDATLIETHKREALPCYKGFKAYQPLTCWWAEHGVVLHSEFRDGNVPAGYQQLRVLKDCLAAAAAIGVTKVYLRRRATSRICCCTVGKARFGVIEFAVSADVTEEFRKAARAVAETDGQPLYRTVEGQRYRTDQEFAEVCFVPAWAGHSRRRADYRFLAIREPLRQLDLADAAQLPFPTEEFAARGRFKLFGLVTNRTLPGDQVIWWLRERCGKSEEVHAVMKTDLAGGRMPSGLFGANAAWWTIMILAHNLNAVMKRLVLGPTWVTKRMKALRFALITLPGRIIRHGRRLIIRVVGETLALLLSARRTILALAVAPSG
jgi:Transposase DDE domain group 1